MRRIAGSYNKYMFDFISGGNFLYFSQQCLRVPVTDTGGGVVGCGCVQCQAAARATGELTERRGRVVRVAVLPSG